MDRLDSVIVAGVLDDVGPAETQIMRRIVMEPAAEGGIPARYRQVAIGGVVDADHFVLSGLASGIG